MNPESNCEALRTCYYICLISIIPKFKPKSYFSVFIRNSKWYRRLVSLVGKVPVYRAGGSGSNPGRTNTQGLKIIEVKVAAFALTYANS